MSALDRYRHLAELTFDGGYPSAEAAEALANELYFQRAVQTYLWALPAMNMFAMKTGLGRTFGEGYHVMTVFEERLKPNTLITTPNSDVIYGLTFADLGETGPLVIDAPPRLQALMDDFWHRPLVGPTIDGVSYLGDIGIPGPDQGKGGQYLIVPGGWEPDVDTDDYFVFTCPTNGVFIFARGFFQDVHDLGPGVAAIEGIAIRPLHGEARPMEFINGSAVDSNALFPTDATYFDLLDDFIQGERVDDLDPYMHGVLAALGITKGETFAPTATQRELLDYAARTAWKMAKSIAANFDEEPKARWWSDRQWVAHVLTEQDDFTRTLLNEQWRDRDTGHTHVDAKAHMFINHYSISTAMVSVTAGKGAKYANTYKDSNGDLLRGEHTYRIDLPPDAPAGLFWSVTVYDAETAAGVDVEGQTFPSLNSLNDLQSNPDGSVTMWIGPDPEPGKPNWLRTPPGRGWFSLIRWYGPKQDFFDRKYTPGDFVRVDQPARP